MKCKKIIALILTLAILAVAAAAPAPKQKNPLAGLHLTGYSIQSVRPSSMKALSGTVTVKVSNAGETRSFRNVSATLYRGGEKVAHGVCSDMVFVPGTSSVNVSGQVRISDGVSIVSAMRSALSFNPSEYTADVICSVVDGQGRAETFVRRNIPVGTYLK